LSLSVMTYVIEKYDIRHAYISFLQDYYEGDADVIIPCEVAVKSVVPAVKALMAKELVEKHGFKQGQTAELLGISQSAVSKYTREIRGYLIRIDNVEGVQVHIDGMVTLITSGEFDRAKFLRLFCQVCEAVRGNGLMCEWCGKAASTMRNDKCDLCYDYSQTDLVSKRKTKRRIHSKKPSRRQSKRVFV
jgi:predicted transcriptional regulator